MALNYAIIGTGAIGGFYGGKLAQSGKEVHFLFHSDYLYVKEHGLKIDSVNGNVYLPQVNAYCDAKVMPACDVVLVCLKTIRNGILKEILPAITHKNSMVILIQNGLGVEDDLAAELPDLSIAGGLAFICSNKIGPGHIAHLDYGKLNLGVYGNASITILKQVCADFIQAGIEAEVFADLMLARWQKLVWNIPFNGMTVVLNTTTDRLMKQDDTRQLSYELMLEVIRGANKCGYPIKLDYADTMMELTKNMTPYAPSMKLDYDHKRVMEIEYIYSRPIQIALKAGFDMKKISMLEKQLKFIQSEM
jgi:2-dehydropantoate 2-reductase